MANPLPLESVIGFEGNVASGLQLHPDGKTMIYPLGATIVIKELGDAFSQSFLQGHTDEVSCLALSKSGRFLASGQITYMGFTADIIVWDMETRTMVHRMSLHKVKVQSLAFSSDDKYLASLGGQDDNSVVIWDVETGAAVCGSPTANEHVLCVKFFNNTNTKLVTGGNNNLNVWDFDRTNRKIRPTDCRLGQLKRVCKSIVVDEYDEFMYCGTTSGDVLQVSLAQKLFKNSGPAKHRIPKGITANAISPTGHLIIGGGDGSVSILDKESMKTLCVTKLVSGVTSCVVSPEVHKDGGYGMYCGTDTCNIYYLKYSPSQGFMAELIQTCHFSTINDIAFPAGYSEVFATCSTNDIRVWHIREARELLRVQVPNLECKCIAFMADGQSIISGWSDGKIRAFAPQSGRLLYTINDAHTQGVTAIIGTSDCSRIISGGKEGNVRVWRIGPQSQSMVASMKEHKGAVNSIAIRGNDSECVSASSDGSCIIWDLQRFVRNNSLFASTFFKAVVYHPDESQIVTTGTDRKVTWWDAFDGQAIRILDGSDNAELNALAISAGGDVVVSGGGDKDVKLWGYDEGHCYFVGKGHSGAITKVKISPDNEKIVTVGSEGAIFIWQNIPISEAV